MNIFELFGKIGIDNKSANKAIDETTGKAEGAHGKLSAIFGKIGQLATQVGKVMATGLAIGITALAGLTGAATKHYAEYEQLVGGVETLFGAGGKSLEEYAQSVGKSVDDASTEYNRLINAQEDVLNRSKIAYKTAGLSANQYMETATSFSASLIQSVGGDTVKAAKLADQAIIDMSDNANKMGTSMESIQNAYQGFAKQNYTMLDNLKLGYGGTKEEMQRLLDDAEKISGIKYDISSFADVTEAIHVMQEKMGIAGTTSKEAASTISGSIGMVKAAWENFLIGMADPDQDFGALVDSLTESISIALGNIVPRLVETLPRLIQGLSQVIQTLAGYLPQILSALLPGLVTGATELLGALGSTLPSLFMILFDQVLPQVSQAFVTFLEKVFSVPEGSFQGLADGLNLAFATISSMFDVLFGSLSEKDNIDLLTKLGMDPGTAETIITTTTRIGDGVKETFKTAIDIISDIAGKVSEFITWFKKGGIAVDALKSAVVGVTTAWAGYKLVVGVIKGIEAAKNLALGIGNGLMIARAVQTGALTAAEGAHAAATVAGTGAMTAFNAVMAMNPIMLVVMAVIALVGALIWFFTQTETGKEIWSNFVSFLGNVWDGIVEVWSVAWEAISAFFEQVATSISEFAKAVFGDLQLWWSENQAAIQAAFEIVWNAIKIIWETVLDGMMQYGSMIWSIIQTNVQTVIGVIQGIITAVMQAINGDWSGAWETIKGVASTIWNGIKSNIDTVINGISGMISSVMSGISGTVSNIWNGIKSSISNAINGAKDAVSNAINAIKGLFNFQIRWPHIPLPHFSVSGSANPLDWLTGGVPKIGIEWYAKGGIMTAPTLFGFNGNNAMVGGEAGPEAVLPLNKKTLRPIGESVADAWGIEDNDNRDLLERIIEILLQLLDKDADVYLDLEKVGRMTYDEHGRILARGG
ncbi:phage tail protein [Streptococcus suis]|uniref:phage tail protein n=1 Tax=Streptococcus suis TaxID=1307 RepID=UPI00209ADE36|nr:hypothetical protein [Streptococcus suis]MCO8213021.1 hypothetical protein [Streptococcus suis]